MQATLQFNPAHFTADQLRTIMGKAQEWDCAPAEALGRIIKEAAFRFRSTPKKKGALSK